jgi:hypothetical protein
MTSRAADQLDSWLRRDNDQFNNDTNPQSSGGQSKNPRDTNTQWDHTAEPDDGDH